MYTCRWILALTQHCIQTIVHIITYVYKPKINGKVWHLAYSQVIYKQQTDVVFDTCKIRIWSLHTALHVHKHTQNLKRWHMCPCQPCPESSQWWHRLRSARQPYLHRHLPSTMPDTQSWWFQEIDTENLVCSLQNAK